MIIMIIGNYGMIIMIGSLEHQNYNREYPICGNEFWDTLLSENWIIYGTMVIESRHDDDRDSAAQDLEDGENPLDPVLSNHDTMDPKSSSPWTKVEGYGGFHMATPSYHPFRTMGFSLK